jgi:antitoxin (DNA-binding transcriptional repressor) of toxin-antitoxin stability system
VPQDAAITGGVQVEAGLKDEGSNANAPSSVEYDGPIQVITRVSAEAVRAFSDLLNRVRCRGEEFVIEGAGEPVCRLSPTAPPKRLTLEGLASLLGKIPGPNAGFAADVRRAARRQGRPPGSPWGR